MAGPWDLPEGAPHDAVVFTPTQDDLLAAYRLSSRFRLWRVLVAVVIWVVLAVELGVIADLTREGIAVAAAAVIALYGGWVALVRLVLLPSRVARIYRQQAGLREEYVLWADDERVHVRSPHVSGDTPWSHLRFRRENARMILLYESDALFRFVPKRALTAEQLERLQGRIARIPEKR